MWPLYTVCASILVALVRLSDNDFTAAQAPITDQYTTEALVRSAIMRAVAVGLAEDPCERMIQARSSVPMDILVYASASADLHWRPVLAATVSASYAADVKPDIDRALAKAISGRDAAEQASRDFLGNCGDSLCACVIDGPLWGQRTMPVNQTLWNADDWRHHTLAPMFSLYIRWTRQLVVVRALVSLIGAWQS